jgi:hypothetical protein
MKRIVFELQCLNYHVSQHIINQIHMHFGGSGIIIIIIIGVVVVECSCAYLVATVWLILRLRMKTDRSYGACLRIQAC